MAFDSTKPADHSPIVSAELRNQFNALKALIDAQQSQIATLQSRLTALEGKATAIAGIPTNDLIINDPPGGDEVNDLYAKVKSIINDMKA